MPVLPPTAAAAMFDVMDGLSRGLNHALSNRVNTLNTLLAVLQDTPDHDPEILAALAAEEARFERLLALYRLMPLDLKAAREPLLLTDPATDALALFHHHLDLRMLPCDVSGLEEAPPVRCQRQLLTQALLVLLVVVGRPVAGDEAGHGLTFSAAATADDVVLRVSTTRPAPPVDEAVWQAMEWLASTLGAKVVRGHDDGHPWAALALTTLAAEKRKGR